MDYRLSRIARNIDHHGYQNALADIGLRLLNRICFFKVVECITLDTVDPRHVKCDEKFRGSFVSVDRLREFAKNPEYELSDRFLDRALAKRDDCYAFFDGATLASYGWYSNKPTETDWAGLTVHFENRYVYMFKGFTLPAYRGNRLYAIGMARALQTYLARGYKGMVAYVEWNNFESLKSSFRIGYRKFGTIYGLGLFNRYLLHTQPGCSPYRFRLERGGPFGVRKLQVPV